MAAGWDARCALDWAARHRRAQLPPGARRGVVAAARDTIACGEGCASAMSWRIRCRARAAGDECQRGSAAYSRTRQRRRRRRPIRAPRRRPSRTPPPPEPSRSRVEAGGSWTRPLVRPGTNELGLLRKSRILLSGWPWRASAAMESDASARPRLVVGVKTAPLINARNRRLIRRTMFEALATHRAIRAAFVVVEACS